MMMMREVFALLESAARDSASLANVLALCCCAPCTASLKCARGCCGRTHTHKSTFRLSLACRLWLCSASAPPLSALLSPGGPARAGHCFCPAPPPPPLSAPTNTLRAAINCVRLTLAAAAAAGNCSATPHLAAAAAAGADPEQPLPAGAFDRAANSVSTARWRRRSVPSEWRQNVCAYFAPRKIPDNRNEPQRRRSRAPALFARPLVRSAPLSRAGLGHRSPLTRCRG